MGIILLIISIILSIGLSVMGLEDVIVRPFVLALLITGFVFLMFAKEKRETKAFKQLRIKSFKIGLLAGAAYLLLETILEAFYSGSPLSGTNVLVVQMIFCLTYYHQKRKILLGK